LTFFERDVFNCDWTKDPPNVPKGALLSELSLYTPPMTPGDGEFSKESNDIENSKSHLLPKDSILSEIYHENKLVASRTDSDNLQLKLLNQKGISTEGGQSIEKDESANTSRLKAELSNSQNIDFAIFPNIEESYDNQIVEDCELLYMNTTIDLDKHSAKDFNVIDNVHKESHPKDLNEQTNDSSNEYLEKSKQNKSKEIQLNDTVSSSNDNIKMLSPNHPDNMPGTDLVGDADCMNIDIMFEDILHTVYNDNECIDDNWIKSLIS